MEVLRLGVKLKIKIMDKSIIQFQKLKSVIKNIILGILLIISHHTYSQKERLNGKYSNLASLQEYYNFYVFDENGEFEYHTGASLGDDYFGKGTYKFMDNLLILNYDKTEPLKTGRHVSKIWTNNSKTIDIHFRFFDFNNSSIPFVNVIYKDSLSKNGYNGIIANKDGIAQLTLTRENKDFHFALSNLGFSQYEFTLDKKYNYDISVYLQKEGNGLPIRNQVDTIAIEKRGAKYFTVKNNEGKVFTWRKIED